MKKLLSIILCLTVLMSFAFAFSATAFAATPDQNANVQVTYWHPELNQEKTIETSLASLEQFIEKNCYEADNSNRTIKIDLRNNTWLLDDEVYLSDGNYSVKIYNGTIDGQQKTRAFWIQDAETELYFEKVVIQNCKSDDGGAIYVNDDTCWIHGSDEAVKRPVFKNCKTTNCGGAIRLSYAADGTVIEYIDFDGNSAEDDGGAILNNGYGTRIDNCNFTNNHANDAGGAIYCWDDTSIVECNFNGNTCGCGEGADIYRSNSGLNVVISGCDFAKRTGTVNFTTVSGSYGGTLLSDGSYLIIIAILALALVAVTFFAIFKKNNVKQE